MRGLILVGLAITLCVSLGIIFSAVGLSVHCRGCPTPLTFLDWRAPIAAMLTLTHAATPVLGPLQVAARASCVLCALLLGSTLMPPGALLATSLWLLGYTLFALGLRHKFQDRAVEWCGSAVAFWTLPAALLHNCFIMLLLLLVALPFDRAWLDTSLGKQEYTAGSGWGGDRVGCRETGDSPNFR